MYTCGIRINAKLVKEGLKTRHVSHHHLRLWHQPCLLLSVQSGRTRHCCYEIWYRRILLPNCGYRCGGSRCQAHPGMYEVVDELRRTGNCSCNHRLGHGINLSGTRRKTAVVWKASLKVTNAFLNLASAPLGILSQHSRYLWYSCMTAPAHILL